MSASQADRPFPRGALLGASAMVGFAILAAALGHVIGVGAAHLPASSAVENRDLRFEDRNDGAVVARELNDDTIVAVIAPGTNGFLRGVLRGLARDRKRSELDARLPFRLTRWADGKLSLQDRGTGHLIDLGAFGATNAQAFARLMDAGRTAR